MNIYKALDTLEKIERDTSDLYQKLYKDHRLNKEAAQFFYNMHLESEAHVKLVRMERRIVQSSPKSFSEPQINFSEINSLLENIAVLKTTELGLPELIGRIYGIESSLAKKYLIDAMKETNESLHDLLTQLDKIAFNHLDEVNAFAEKLGVKIEDIQNRYLRKARVAYDDRVMIDKAMAVRGVDLSEGGMFLLTGRTFPAGVSISLQFKVLEMTITTDAEVQFFIEGVGMGVKFRDLADNDRELMAQFVAQRIAEKGLEWQKRLLIVGGHNLSDREMRIYVSELYSAGYKVVDVSGFDETMNYLRKGMELACIILSIETETDANYYLLHFLSNLDHYWNLPIIVMTNNQNEDFRELLIRRGVKKLLYRLSTSPKRLAEEINALTA